MVARVFLVLFFLAFFSYSASSQTLIDPQLPEYEPTQGVSGSLKSLGSDTMNNLMTLWSEGFRSMYPNVTIEIEGKGSSTAPPALIQGAAHFGPMSRTMRQAEIDEFERAFGYEPTLLRTGTDVLAVYVNKDNPIEGLSLQQLDAIFSNTRRGGYSEDIRTWGQLGLTGAWANQTVSLYGRNAASGTYGFFKDNALFGGDYKDSVKEQAGSSSVIQGVASERNAIGYSGIGYQTADVRAVPIAPNPGGEYIPAEAEYAYSGEYPLVRFLYIYVNHQPGSEMDPLRREFIRYIFSRQGQTDVMRNGYFPVSAPLARQTLEALNIDPGF